MAVGRPDYWLRISPERTLPGAGQEFVSVFKADTVEAADIATLFDYSVPAGYTLFITGIDITCNLPGSKAGNIFSLGPPVDNWSFYFDMQYHITRDWIEKAPGGARVYLMVQNYETYDIIVTSAISGYLEEGIY